MNLYIRIGRYHAVSAETNLSVILGQISTFQMECLILSSFQIITRYESFRYIVKIMILKRPECLIIWNEGVTVMSVNSTITLIFKNASRQSISISLIKSKPLASHPHDILH
jgi:archaellum biogenesis ATPase FlaH